MVDGGYVASIDVGTTKICTIVARVAGSGQLDILGVGLQPSRGLREGVVVDHAHAVESVQQSVSKAEQTAQLPIGGAYVGVTGAHIKSRNVTGRVRVASGDEITSEDVEQAIQSACDNVALPHDREIIHTLVRDFAIDSQRGVKRPLGMHASRLDANIHVVSAAAGALRNVAAAVEEAGVEVQKQVLEPVATSLAVLAEGESDLGVVLMDIGGGTTDLAVFANGAIAHSGAIPVAGNQITSDIAKLLRISYEQAEEVKKQFGTAFADMMDDDDAVLVEEIGTREQVRVPRGLIADIIQARLVEIFQLTIENLQQAAMYDTVTSGVVLTGGGSQLPGTLEMASEIMENTPVRIGSARGVGRGANRVASPIFATGVGLALYAAEEGADASPISTPSYLEWVEKARSWWRTRVQPRISPYLPEL